jgi:anionic cell wall polymer biosynthesis LytR-Cps2A-Psr (LCP) family protein
MKAWAKIFGAIFTCPSLAGQWWVTLALPVFLFIFLNSASADDARLVIRTSPGNALVKVDGRLLSRRSPVTARLSPGMHRISAALSGYQNSTRSLHIYPGLNYLSLSLMKEGVEREKASPALSSSRCKKSSPRTKKPKAGSESRPEALPSKQIQAPRPAATPSHELSLAATQFFPVPENIPPPPWPDSAEEYMFKKILNLPRLPDKLNILVLGLDRRDRRGILARGPEIPPEKLKRIRARSDVIMLAQLDLAQSKIRVVSIPRDTRVYLSRGRGFGKINEAYFIGRISFAKKIIGGFMDVPIHRYIVLDYRSMKNLIKIYHSLGFKFQGFSDRQLFWYLRKRSFHRGDLKRIERQQAFLRAAARDYLSFANRMNRKQGLLGWAEQTVFDTVFRQGLNLVDTDITFEEVRYLTYLFREYDIDQVTFATVPGRVGGKRFGEDDEEYVSYFYPNMHHDFDQIIAQAERKQVSRRP